MSQLIVCDICAQRCNPIDYLKFSGWWGKHLRHEKSRQSAWEPKLLDTTPQIKADVCRQCFDTHYGFALQSCPTRQSLIDARRQMSPNEPPIKTLRMTALAGCAEGVNCDRCGSECFSKHLKIEASSLDHQGHSLTSELCQVCVEQHVTSLIQSAQAVS